MRKITIDRNIWLRGEGTQKSSLLRTEDKKQCCVGIYLSQCGVSEDLMLGVGDYDDIVFLNRRPILPEETRWLLDHRLAVQCGKESIYLTNDNIELTNEERESKLKRLFAQHDVEIEFVN